MVVATAVVMLHPSVPAPAAGGADDPFVAVAPNLAPTELTKVGDTLFFTGYDTEHKRELWRSDGTRRGTSLVKDINPADGDYDYPTGLTAVGSRLFFVADDGVHGNELWSSGGTRRTTRMIGDLAPGSVSSHPTEITAVGRVLFLDARESDSDADIAYSVWRLRRLLPRR